MARTNNFRNLDLIYFSNDDEFEDEFFVEESSRWIYKYTDEFSFMALLLLNVRLVKVF